MSNFLNQQLTNVGWDALSTALGGGRLTFFKMQAGDGTIASDSAIPGMTALVNPICDVALVKYEIDGQGQVTLFGNIASAQLDAGFTFRELGVFATIEQPVASGALVGGVTAVVQESVASPKSNPVVPNPPVGTTLMYAYCNSYLQSDYIPGIPDAGSTDVVNSLQVVVKIDKAANVVINIAAGTQLSITNIGAPTVGAGPWSYTQANVAYMKRLVPGARIIISEDANTINIAENVLTQDLNLNVLIGANDVFPNFSTINRAIAYLKNYTIPINVTATITVGAGTWTQNNAPTVIDHLNGQQIKIIGNTSQTRNILSYAGTTGTAGNYSTSFNVDDVSDINVNDWVICLTRGSVVVRGVFKVTAKVGNKITVKNPYSQTPFPTITATITGTIIALKTIISCPAGDGMDVGPIGGGLGLLQGIMFVGNTTTPPQYALAVVSVAVTAKNLGAVNWGSPTNSSILGGAFGASNNLGYLNGTNLHCASCYNGITCDSGAETDTYGSGSISCYWGYRSVLLGVFKAYDTYAADCLYGFAVGNGSEAFFDDLLVSYCTQWAVYIAISSSVVLTVGTGKLTSINNSSYDIVLAVLCSMSYNGGVITYNVANFTKRVLTADGCYCDSP